MQACCLPYSVGQPAPLLAQPWDGGEGGPCRALQAGESPPAVQDQISPVIPHAAGRRVSGPLPSWGLLL